MLRKVLFALFCGVSYVLLGLLCWKTFDLIKERRANEKKSRVTPDDLFASNVRDILTNSGADESFAREVMSHIK